MPCQSMMTPTHKNHNIFTGRGFNEINKSGCQALSIDATSKNLQ